MQLQHLLYAVTAGLSLLFLISDVAAQNVPYISYSSSELQEHLPLYRWPYASKVAPRIGGSVESSNDKLRLDIGGTVLLFSNSRVISFYKYGGDDVSFHGDNGANDSSKRIVKLWSLSTDYVVLGADFFTWSRLRSEANFKFPVEAVDYYLGLYGSVRLNEIGDRYTYPHGSNEIEQRRTSYIASLRVAHISAHLVDGDPEFLTENDAPAVHSREFIDLSFAVDHLFWKGAWIAGVHRPRNGFLRPYLGAQWLFSTIPDTLGRITPYVGIDASIQVLDGKGPALRVGYEFRLNTEYKTIGEHSFRAGVKLSDVYDNGVVIEGGYSSGRSPYGQYFDRKEEYFSLGFSLEH